jgi:hypothetical protein
MSSRRMINNDKNKITIDLSTKDCNINIEYYKDKKNYMLLKEQIEQTAFYYFNVFILY